MLVTCKEFFGKASAVSADVSLVLSEAAAWTVRRIFKERRESSYLEIKLSIPLDPTSPPDLTR
jgi:hypothetical protein